MNTYLIISIASITVATLFFLQALINHIERKRYLVMIENLTNKVMSKSYGEYLMGKELEKEEEITTRPRTDVDEALIEQENLEALEAKTKKLGEQLDKAQYSEVG